MYNADRPEIHAIVAEMRSVVDEFPDRVLIGEIYLPVQQLMTYYGKDLQGANLPFNFQLLQCAWRADAVAEVIAEYEARCPQEHGRTGFWAITISRASRAGRDRPGTGRSHAAADTARHAHRSTTARRLGMTERPDPAGQVQDPAEKNEPGWAWAAIRSVRRCAGMVVQRGVHDRLALAAPWRQTGDCERGGAGAG